MAFLRRFRASSQRRPPRFSLRFRVSLAFGLGALLVTAALSLITYELTRANLLDRREETSLARAFFNATQVSRLSSEETTEERLRELAQDLYTPLGSRPVIRLGDLWISANPVEFSEPQINQSLKNVVANGNAARMRYVVDQTPFAVIGLPFPQLDAAYFEAVPLTDISDTLGTLRIIMLTSSAITVLLGIGIGIWAAQRTVRPLSDIGEAAEAIAAGDLSTRLENIDPDLERLSRSFNQMASALEERIERDARFTSNVSHELRSPLMALTASLEVLNHRKEELPERSRTALSLITSDIEHFRRLVADLLEISRYDAGVVALELEEFKVVEFLRQTLRAGGYEPILTWNEDVGEVVLRADRRRLGQVMTNLLDNASHHGDGVTEVRLERSGSMLDILILDEGPGVSEEDRKIIFDRFSRGRDRPGGGRSLGTGLGLALVNEHVRLHGGAIRISDRPDGKRGACFVVSLPLSPSSSEET